MKTISAIKAAIAAILLCLSAASYAQEDMKKTTILLDPGHDYQNMGALASSGKPEYLFNMRIADELKNRLEENGFRVMLTHGENELSSLKDRTLFSDYDLFISLHHDSIDPEYCVSFDAQKSCTTYSGYGYSLWVSPQNPDYVKSYRMAELIGQELTAEHFIHSVHHVMVTKREALDEHLGIFSFPLCYVLRHNSRPAILIEFAVITNPVDEKNAEDPVFRGRFVGNIVKGLIRYVSEEPGSEDKAVTPKDAGRRKVSASPLRKHRRGPGAPALRK
ncbi:MAG: N-acetylmuramoyl-L-alanine amidase [Succinivibrionaceae bacterium]|nr:N-acetylmuramoyl-L-alanine amidase [Succinivibrionaceae bacterium]